MAVKSENKIVGRFSVKQIGPESDRILEFIGTDESLDRDGDIIKSDAWDFTNYKKNPVFLWCHDYWSVPIGKCVGINQSMGSTGTSFQIKFASIEELSTNPNIPSSQAQLADTVYNAYKNGYLNAVSVGFIGNESQEIPEQDDVPVWERGRMFTSVEMLELSAVGIPSNPNALVQARSAKSMKTDQINMLEKIMNIETKGAIPYKKFPLADEGASWDGPAVIKDADTDDLKIICAWYDSENADVKSSYKLPHHMGSADGHKTVWAGVRAAMGALLGARGGVDIPEGDRKAVYNHLKKHYDDFGKDAPDFKTYTQAELKTIFDEGDDEMTQDQVTKAIADAVAPLLEEIKMLKVTSKAGARLSQATYASMKALHDHMTMAVDMCKGIMDGTGEEPEGNSPSESKPGIENSGSELDDGDEDAAAGKSNNEHDIDVKNIDWSKYQSA